jgi:hypothetical protein
MFVHETNSRDTFLANCPPGVPIRVVRMATVQAVRRGGGISMVPAVELTYSFMTADHQWVYREIKLAQDARGRIDLSDTLWAELERRGDASYELLQRSGSF